MRQCSTLIKAMEDYRGEFCVILAGYKNQMHEKCLRLTRDFSLGGSNLRWIFQNHNRDELGQIAALMLKSGGYTASNAAKDRMLDITDYIRKEPNFANAREMRNIIEQVINARQNVRCAGTADKTLELVDVNNYIKENHVNLPTSGEGTERKSLYGRG